MICQFKKDHNKGVKLSYKGGFNTNYKTQYMKKKELKLPVLYQDNRLDSIAQKAISISGQTNNQGEFIQKGLQEKVRNLRMPDSLQQSGPTAKYSSYFNSFRNFSGDNKVVDKIIPVDKNGLELKFEGITNYKKQFVQFGAKDYIQEWKVGQEKLTPFGQYIPFQDETTQLDYNRYLRKDRYSRKSYDLKNGNNMFISSIDQQFKQAGFKAHFSTESKKQYDNKCGDEKLQEPTVQKLQKEQFRQILLDKIQSIKLS